MNYSIVSVSAIQKFFAVIAVLAMVFGPASQAFAVPGNGGGNGGGGSVWTNIGPCGSPQNVNHYTVGDDFYGHGSGFTPNTQYAWVVKEPGNGGDTIESGSITTDGAGAFCEKLFEIEDEHIGGPYQFNVGDSKNDNFSVVAATPTTGTLTVLKTLITDNGIVADEDDFSFQVNGGASVSFEEDGSNILTLPAGTYTVTETASTNFDTTYSNCSNVELTAGGSATCTITNNDKACAPGTIGVYPNCTPIVIPMFCMDPLANNFMMPLPCTYTPVDLSCELVSDETTQEGGASSFEVPKNGAWATISGADWIWGDASVIDGTVDTIQTFTKVFDLNATPTAATIDIASDNGYKLVVNGTTIVDRLSELATYNPATTHDILSALDANAENTIEITVKNAAWPTENPAGLAYKISIEDASCTVVDQNKGSVTVTKAFIGATPADWSFGFTTTGFDDNNFTLTDGDSSVEITNLDAGTFTITENAVEGWNLENVVCELSNTDTIVGATSTTGVTLNLTAGQDVNCVFTNDVVEGGNENPAQCISEANLLSNGSFEAPAVTANGGQWENFAAVTGWTLLADGLELWNGLFGGANDGSQSAELDGNAAATTSISQSVTTVVGNDYKLTYDFAARPNTDLANNELDVVIDGTVVDTVSADGTGDGSIVWGTYTYEFTAATTSTVVEFRDAGTDDGYGTLLDGAELCLTEDNSDNEPDTYRVFGQVWHDENSNDERDLSEEDSEDFLEGWLITITDNDGFVATTTSDEYGNYAFELPAGEYVITQTMQEGWSLTFPNDGSWEVCVPIACEDEETLIEELLSMIVPTAYAAVAANNGPLNFGNVRSTPGYSQGSYGGGGNGRSISLRDGGSDNDDDEPEGQVLGEATSTMPVGAPNTGAGGASVLSFSLHGLVAILATRKGVQVSNGK